jgi:drug/metabolite transporter (DMT)-like permease
MLHLGVAACLGGSISSGFAYLCMGRLKTIHSVVNPFWFGIFTCIVSYCLLVFLNRQHNNLTWFEVFLLTAMGIFGWVA